MTPCELPRCDADPQFSEQLCGKKRDSTPTSAAMAASGHKLCMSKLKCEKCTLPPTFAQPHASVHIHACRGGAAMAYHNRKEAGQRLAKKLSHYQGRDDVLVLGLPRGGVPVAFEVAKSLRAPLDVFLVRKLGVPGWSEYAMGAIASGGLRVINEAAVRRLGISQDAIDAVTAREERELERRDRMYRAGQPPVEIQGRTVILVDDGLATGSTMQAAAIAIRTRHPRRLVVAVPIGAPDTCDEFRAHVDEVICAEMPADFRAVGLSYDDFGETSDREVQALLAAARARRDDALEVTEEEFDGHSHLAT
jgi:putative phosphoribosyl transferase